MLVIGQEIWEKRRLTRKKGGIKNRKFALICGKGISRLMAKQFAREHFNGEVDVFLRDSDNELIPLDGLTLPKCRNRRQLEAQAVWTLPLTLARDYEYINSICLFHQVQLQAQPGKHSVIVFHGYEPRDYHKLALGGVHCFQA